MVPKDVLREIVLSQNSFISRLNDSIPRDKPIKIMNSFVIVITGIRRCGKSTYLNQILKNQNIWYYLNLEDPRLDGFELADFERFDAVARDIHGNGGVYFFDEIQTVLNWEKFIRYLVDKKERVILTGSNASILGGELATKLTGRYLQMYLFPFSYNEFLRIEGGVPSADTLMQYLYQGGFPEYLKTKDALILQELFSDIIIKDISVRFGVRRIALIKKIALFLISNIGKEFSYNSIKNSFGIKSVQTVIDYISYFQNSYLFFVVPCFNYSYKSQIVGPKKIYSIDNGLTSANSLSFSKDEGKMLENAVFLALKRKYDDIFYYKKEYECDFLIKTRDKVTLAMQACAHLNAENREREIYGLMAALKEFKLASGLIITIDQEDVIILEDKQIQIVPCWKWFS
jgi:predicted AAA+ superfamily ATPase